MKAIQAAAVATVCLLVLIETKPETSESKRQRRSICSPQHRKLYGWVTVFVRTVLDKNSPFLFVGFASLLPITEQVFYVGSINQKFSHFHHHDVSREDVTEAKWPP
uniref:Putative secreted protein n=1 Tax=Anopheles marajoara TaxID=58244 RepID=A0A2M4C8S8_9DIPT